MNKSDEGLLKRIEELEDQILKLKLELLEASMNRVDREAIAVHRIVNS